MSLHGQHVMVVGGSSGIGLGVARAALAAGARVTLVARTAERLAAARERLERESGHPERVRSIAADVAREADVARAVAESGPLDHLVTTAVSVAYMPIEAFDVEAAQRVIGSKLVGPLLLARYGAPALRPGGSIILTAGINAHRPSPGGAVLAAANGALEALGRALAVELAPLRVNVVAPGWVDTPVWDDFAGDRKTAMHAAMAARLPAGRVGTAEDLAEAYLFLMRSAYTTGIVLHVDGGHRLV